MTLVERLREGPFGLDPSKAMVEAADRIEELEGVLEAIWKDVFEDKGPIYSDTGRLIYAAIKERK